MKKKIIIIVSIVLAAAILIGAGVAAYFVFFRQDENDKIYAKLEKVYGAISPTKIVTVTTEEIGKYTLTSEATFVTGKVDGKYASVYEYKQQKLRDIDSGASTDDITTYWVETVGKLEYLEDKGLRVDGGKWDEAGEDFSPEAGKFALNTTKKTVADLKEDTATNTITFTILKDSTEAVFGEGNAIEADVYVTVTHDGGAVTGVIITYTIETDIEKYPDMVVTIRADYSYDPITPTID